MNYQQFVDSLSPEVVARLRGALETGRWPDGSALSAEQKEHSMRAVIAWDEQHLPEDQRIGFIDTRGLQAREKSQTDEREQKLRWVDNPGTASAPTPDPRESTTPLSDTNSTTSDEETPL